MWEGKAAQEIFFFLGLLISNLKLNTASGLVFPQVVCQSCSSNKCYLEYLKSQLARVCDQCFLVLQQQNSEFFHSSLYFWNQVKVEIIDNFRFRRQVSKPWLHPCPLGTKPLWLSPGSRRKYLHS